MNCPSHCRHRLLADAVDTDNSGCQSVKGSTVRSDSSLATAPGAAAPIAKHTALARGLRNHVRSTTEGNEYKINGTGSSESSVENHKACWLCLLVQSWPNFFEFWCIVRGRFSALRWVRAVFAGVNRLAAGTFTQLGGRETRDRNAADFANADSRRRQSSSVFSCESTTRRGRHGLATRLLWFLCVNTGLTATLNFVKNRNMQNVLIYVIKHHYILIIIVI